ncbi:hypothetical protein B9065_007905 [Klebsiella pneumoniae]|nr:hypothetical protein B9065_007905 [Klebsiella pneumoniae]
MVKKSLRQFTLMATATVTLLLGSVPLYAQTADVQQKLAELEYSLFSPREHAAAAGAGLRRHAPAAAAVLPVLSGQRGQR